jgi:6-phospho-beta-glucosidase
MARHGPKDEERDVGLKVAVIGGGSTYTPELIEGLAARQDALPIDEVALLDIDPERLAIVAGLARRIVARTAAAIVITETTDRAEAFEGADFVLVQLRVGGQAARLVDETLPPRFACIGQETTGPGGFAKALRTVPVVLELAEEAARRATPAAWIIDFTNPVGIVTQALLDAGHRAIGLCNVAIGLQRQLAEHWGVAPDRVELEHVGLNHLTWLRAARVDGADRLPAFIDNDLDAIVDDHEMPHTLVRALGAIPSYYLRYYYMTGEVLARQRDGHTRAEDVIDIERELLERYRDPTLDRKPRLLERRGGAHYSEAAAQLMASLHAGTGDVQVVDTRNLGTIAGLPADAVVEVPARIDHSGATPLSQAPLAPEMLGLVQAVKAYEMLTAEAARTGDRTVALRALLANPLVPDYPTAVALLDAFLAADAAQLPRFATVVQ